MKRRTSVPKTAGFVPPYPPSWFDRFKRVVERMPGPPWAAYLGLAVVLTAIVLLAAGSTGQYRPGPFLPFHIWIAAQAGYMLGLMHYLDRSAATALASFRPVLAKPRRGSEKTEAALFQDLSYRLTNLPRRMAQIALVVGAAFGLLLTFLIAPDSQTTVSASLDNTFVAFGFPGSSPALIGFMIVFHGFVEAVSATLVVHTVHQLWAISQVLTHHTRLNLYQVQPLYAFSIPTGLTAIGITLYNYAWFAFAPGLLSVPISRALGLFFIAVAVLTFAWPLYGIHRRLAAEKKRLIGESTARFEAAVTELHRRVDQKQLRAMDDLNKTLASLEIELAALRRIPTWPWEPGTVRGVAVAVFLPILLWLGQWALERMLS